MKKSTRISISNDSGAMLDEKEYVFRTALAEPCFTSGVNYWELTMDPRTENEMKIGVCWEEMMNYDTAYCDHSGGFAYYTLG